MNPERFLHAIYEDTWGRQMTDEEKAELLLFLEWVIRKVDNGEIWGPTIH